MLNMSTKPVCGSELEVLYLDKAEGEERVCLEARSEVEVLPPIINHRREGAVVCVRIKCV